MAEGDVVTNWDTAGSGNASPKGCAADNTYVYVADGADDEVYVYTTGGTSVTNWDTNAAGSQDPEAMACDGTYVYISDPVDNKVYVFTTGGTSITSWGTSTGNGSGYGCGTAGNIIYVADNVSDKVFLYTTGGTYLSEWGKSSGHGSIVGCCSNGVHVWVGNNTPAPDEIWKYTTGGTYVSKFACSGLNANINDIGMSLDGQYMFVSDSADDEVYVYEGVYIPPAVDVTVTPSALALSFTAGAPTINVLRIPTTQTLSLTVGGYENLRIRPYFFSHTVVGTGSLGTRIIRKKYPHLWGLTGGTYLQNRDPSL